MERRQNKLEETRQLYDIFWSYLQSREGKIYILSILLILTCASYETKCRRIWFSTCCACNSMVTLNLLRDRINLCLPGR